MDWDEILEEKDMRKQAARNLRKLGTESLMYRRNRAEGRMEKIARYDALGVPVPTILRESCRDRLQSIEEEIGRRNRTKRGQGG